MPSRKQHSVSSAWPYCTASAITVEMLKGEAPLPSVANITNGVVIELCRFARKRRIPDDRVGSWLQSIGVTDHSAGSAARELFNHRDQLRRHRRSDDIAMLECKTFDPHLWPPSEPQLPVSPSIQCSINAPSTSTKAPMLPSITSKAPMRDDKKLDNTLSHEIVVKQRRLEQLNEKIEAEAASLQVKNRRYCIANINKREKRACLKIKRLEQDNAALRKSLACHKKQMDSSKKAISNLIRKFAGQDRNSGANETCSKCPALNEDLVEARQRICSLDADVGVRSVVKTKDEDGSFSADLKMCVTDLVGVCEVSAGRVGDVITSVGNHLFHYSFENEDLPCENTCINIVQESTQSQVDRRLVAVKMEPGTQSQVDKCLVAVKMEPDTI